MQFRIWDIGVLKYDFQVRLNYVYQNLKNSYFNIRILNNHYMCTPMSV